MEDVKGIWIDERRAQGRPGGARVPTTYPLEYSAPAALRLAGGFDNPARAPGASKQGGLAGGASFCLRWIIPAGVPCVAEDYERILYRTTSQQMDRTKLRVQELVILICTPLTVRHSYQYSYRTN
eukprot:scaffold337396_cov17-Prasinocladus_malaysianus.AAC.1